MIESNTKVFLRSVDCLSGPIGKAIARMSEAQRAWAARQPQPVSGPAIRSDVVRALRAIALADRSPDEYLMAIGIGGPNPCRSKPVLVPLWDAMPGETL